MDALKDVAMPVFLILLGVIGFFLRRADDQQARQIALLFVKHDDDAKALQDLRERIAREHYVKGELDQRFQRLEDAFRAGFQDIGGKLDKLTNVLVDHIAKGK